MQYEPYEPPSPLKIPYGFTVSETEQSYNIEHFRAGMGCLNLFFSCWIAGWVIGMFTLFVPSEGLHFEILGFLIPITIVSLCLIHSICTKKVFTLGETTLTVTTKILFLSWKLTLPRETITHLIQIKHSKRRYSFFPCWGLHVKSASNDRNVIDRIMSLNHFRPDVRYRSLLFQLPYEHSYWLGITISRWADARLDLLPHS